MNREYKLLQQVCTRCDNFPNGQSCNNKDECPVYQLYLIAKKEKVQILLCSDWKDKEELLNALKEWMKSEK